MNSITPRSSSKLSPPALSTCAIEIMARWADCDADSPFIKAPSALAQLVWLSCVNAGMVDLTQACSNQAARPPSNQWVRSGPYKHVFNIRDGSIGLSVDPEARTIVFWMSMPNLSDIEIACMDHLLERISTLSKSRAQLQRRFGAPNRHADRSVSTSRSISGRSGKTPQVLHSTRGTQARTESMH